MAYDLGYLTLSYESIRDYQRNQVKLVPFFVVTKAPYALSINGESVGGKLVREVSYHSQNCR